MENIAEKLNLVIDYIERHLTEDIDPTVDRIYYVADGTVWRDMPSTRRFVISE